MDKILPQISPSEGIMQAVEDFNYIMTTIKGDASEKEAIAMSLIAVLYAPVPHYQQDVKADVE